MSKETIFEQLNKISVKGKTDTKGKFTYLSWVYAWSELKKVAPDSTVKVYHDERTGLPYFTDGDAGVMVKVGVTVNGLEHINYLPCMNFSNKAIKASDVNMMDVNKAIQRATVKAIALHGLGLYIYAGEDLPEGEEPVKSPVKSKPKVVAKSKNSFRDSKKPDVVVESVVDDEEL
jgi:hypothetical protein|tara:strand:+ start:1237 stop:1761 length:525 start_codon:yes stop_codon:yes gene_type:complete